MASTSRPGPGGSKRDRKEEGGRGSSPGVLNPAEWRSEMPGIPDEYFERSERVPITKEEIRAVLLSKAGLYGGCHVLEIGCGSGSITAEAAIHVTGSGLVTAIDRDADAVELTKRNLERFGVGGRVGVICGDALTVLRGSGDGDGPGATRYGCVIIGGTGGDTADILRECAGMLAPGGRMVITTILVETLHAVLGATSDLGWDDVDITQVTISKSRRTSTGTMMLARNPVTIVTATRPSAADA